MTVAQRFSLPAATRSWANDGSAIPNWLLPRVVGQTSTNGSFLLTTALGAVRVHCGDVVIEHQGELWCRPATEIPALMNALIAEAAPAVMAIGPGKAAQFGTRSAGKRRTRGGDRRMAFGQPRGTMPSVEWVHVTDLTVDHSYQRSIDNDPSRRLIASIAANFDWRLCAPLVVSRRSNGTKVIIDGQHRWAAAVRRGDLPQLPCCLFTYENPEDEARMFIVANRARKAINRLDDFHAALAATDEDATEIKRLVAEARLTIARTTSSTSWKPGEVAFTSSIAKALRRHGESIVSAALTVIAEAYEGQPLTHGASVFGALVRIFANPPEEFDPDELVPVMKHFGMSDLGEIVREQKGGDARAAALARVLVRELGGSVPMPTET